ncbi:MAG TPA: hypothetical protein PK777_18265, partial [Thermoguttaceae bacterium]|nr:hypothetical protein [Thermoguttaceae bacterium]
MESSGSREEEPRCTPSEENQGQTETGGAVRTDSSPAPSGPCPGESPLCTGSPQMVLPEKRWRLAVLLGAGVVLLGGAAGLGALGYQITRLDRLQPDQLREAIGRLQWSAAGIACLGAGGFLGATLWLCRLGWKINRTGQYPPPGMRVLWKTQIRQGPPALL